MRERRLGTALADLADPRAHLCRSASAPGPVPQRARRAERDRRCDLRATVQRRRRVRAPCCDAARATGRARGSRMPREDDNFRGGLNHSTLLRLVVGAGWARPRRLTSSRANSMYGRIASGPAPSLPTTRGPPRDGACDTPRSAEKTPLRVVKTSPSIPPLSGVSSLGEADAPAGPNLPESSVQPRETATSTVRTPAQAKRGRKRRRPWMPCPTKVASASVASRSALVSR